MGFFNLQLTVSMYASTADISTTTRPSFACPSVPATSIRDWWTTRSNPAFVVLIGRQGTVSAPKKGHRSTPEFWFGTVNPSILYQDLATSNQIHKTERMRLEFRDTDNPEQRGYGPENTIPCIHEAKSYVRENQT